MNRKVVDGRAQQIKSKKKPFSVSYLDYNSTEVYMVVKQEREHVHHIKLEMELSIREVFPLSGGAIFTIILFMMLFMALVVSVLILWLNKIGIISIYVPKKLRVYCLKNYMSYEEREIYGHDAQVGDIIQNAKELNLRVNIQPSKFGHKVEDSFFSDHCDSSNYQEELLDPNLGLKNKVEIPTTVKRGKNLSIDDSPPSSSVHGSKEDAAVEESEEEDFDGPKIFYLEEENPLSSKKSKGGKFKGKAVGEGKESEDSDQAGKSQKYIESSKKILDSA